MTGLYLEVVTSFRREDIIATCRRNAMSSRELVVAAAVVDSSSGGCVKMFVRCIAVNIYARDRCSKVGFTFWCTVALRYTATSYDSC